MEWYLKVVRDNYANFKGRARRQEFWMFILFNMLIGMVLGTFSAFLGVIGSIILWCYQLGIIIPTLAAGARRLHDTGRSALWLLIALIPFIGIIILAVLCSQDGELGENKWGANPKTNGLF